MDVVDGALLHEHDLGRGLLVDAASAGSFVSRAAVESLRGYAAARRDAARRDAARRDAARRDAASGDFENPLPGWTARAAWLGRGDVVSLSSTSSLSSVGFQETVGRLPDAFLDEVDAVCVAVDSLGDRRAADELSLRRRFALVDAGVDGDRLSVHVAVPDVTVPWSEGAEGLAGLGPASCVLGNFPHAFQHAARWARDVFGDYFESSPRKTNAYLRDPTFAAETLRSRTRNVHARLADARDVHAALVAERPRDLHACVRWARARFDDARSFARLARCYRRFGGPSRRVRRAVLDRNETRPDAARVRRERSGASRVRVLRREPSRGDVRSEGSIGSAVSRRMPRGARRGCRVSRNVRSTRSR